MVKLWQGILSYIDKLKQTQEIKLFILSMLVVIFFLWGMFKDNYTELKQRINYLEREGLKKDSAKEMQRDLMQDKLDQCAAKRLEEAEKINKASKKLK